jgi:hypothetical protein
LGKEWWLLLCSTVGQQGRREKVEGGMGAGGPPLRKGREKELAEGGEIMNGRGRGGEVLKNLQCGPFSLVVGMKERFKDGCRRIDYEGENIDD